MLLIKSSVAAILAVVASISLADETKYLGDLDAFKKNIYAAKIQYVNNKMQIVKAKRTYSKLPTYDKNALDAVLAVARKSAVFCESRLLIEDGYDIFEFDGFKTETNIYSDGLSQADKLNGMTWRGYITLSLYGGVFRKHDSQTGEWIDTSSSDNNTINLPVLIKSPHNEGFLLPKNHQPISSSTAFLTRSAVLAIFTIGN